MINSRQRAQLRGLANGIDTILQIGKDGLNEGVLSQLEDALRSRELVKGRVLDACPLTAREACDELCRLCRAEPVQVIGSKFILYRENHDMDKDKRIRLVK